MLRVSEALSNKQKKWSLNTQAIEKEVMEYSLLAHALLDLKIYPKAVLPEKVPFKWVCLCNM